jgi:hypothetical protein
MGFFLKENLYRTTFTKFGVHKVKPEVEGIIEIRASTTTSPRPLFW